jgi:argininosuccinate lyase
MRTFSDKIDATLFEALTVEKVVNRRISKGGTAMDNVKSAVSLAADRLASESLPKLQE